MSSSKFSILQLTETKPQFVPTKMMEKNFHFVTLNFDNFLSYSGEVVGIIIEVEKLCPHHCELIKTYKSFGQDFSLCIISQSFDAKAFETLCLLVQTVWFCELQLETQKEHISEELELFFGKIAGFKRYLSSLKEKSFSAYAPVNSLNIVAHQWRQPINLISIEAINLMVQASVEESVKSSLLYEGASIISRETQRMSEILKSVLSLGKSNRVKQKFMLNEMLSKIETLFYDELKRHNIKLSIHYLSHEKYVYGYQTDLEEVIINIVANAKDAYNCAEENRAKEIKIHAGFTDGFLVLSIKDEAGGVPESIREKIFEPNFTTKEKNEGFGIGLHVARLIMEQEFKGALNLTVDEDTTEFIITIPLHDISNMNLIDS